ncbi:MAG: SusE domain-containing protein [Chitinophagaceae bacterium]
MKNRFLYFILSVSVILLMFSCKKEGNITVLQTPVLPTITVSSASVVLSEATAADTVQVITWTPADYGFSAAVSYSIQLAKAATGFATPKEITLGNNRVLKYTGAELNQLALLQGIAPGSTGQLEVRVRSVLTDSIRQYSETITFAVTPYLVVINYPSLWVPGDYQGWKAETAEKISSRLSNGVYEGYIYFASGPTFKFTNEPDWDHLIYGWASSTESGSDVSGTFITGGGNLYVPSTGYFLIKGNTNDNTWSGTKINSWSMIGDFNNWAGDAPLTYDVLTKKWTGTLTAAAAGGFKFRANNDWPINFGDAGADLILDYDGSNIAVTAGTHTVTLDLSVPGNYTYKIQ